MNSSGIKRGLATTAITALAVAGLPLIASSASAASGDSLGYLKTGALRNGNADGGEFYISSSSADLETSLANGDLFVTNPDYSGTPIVVVPGVGTPEITSAAFDLDIIDVTIRDFDPSTPLVIDKYADGLYHYTVTAAITLGSASSAKFGLFEDGDGNNAVSASDPKVSLDITPTGAPASVSISPDSQSTATGVDATYTVTVRDAGGNVTQVVTGEGINLSGTGVIFDDATLDAADLSDGVDDFDAQSLTAGTKTITAAGNGTGATKATITDTATLVVSAQAQIDADEFDLVTGADTYESGDAFGGTYQVRVDQGTITFKFASADGPDLDTTPDDANTVVLLTLVGNGGVKFDGLTSKTYSVALGADGTGSLSVTPTGVVDGAGFSFDSDSFGLVAATDVDFTRASATSVSTDAAAYVTKVGSPTAVTVTVLDQFGDPIGAPAQVSITRGARNGSTTTSRVTVNSAGQATFTLPDAGTTAGTEAIAVNLYDDQFDGSADTTNNAATINYTADGLGADYTVAGVTATATDTKIAPLYDSNTAAGAIVDAATITVAGATANTPSTVTVDNGALILEGGETDLTQGSASQTFSSANTTFQVVGTKLGVVTVTITNAGRTEVYKLTVTRENMTAGQIAATARNVDLTGPAKVTAGDVATYIATVTDAFGNPVPGVTAADLAFTVSGPGNLQNEEAVTDANGELEQTVLLTDNANSDITVRVAGSNGQFGSKADEINGAAAKGLTASVSTDSVTTEVVNLAELQADVDAAQAALDEAQANLQIAQGDLDVAQATFAVAQARVDTAAAKVATLKNKIAKAKANGNRARVKELRKQLRKAKAALAVAQDKLIIATARVTAAQSVVDRRQDQVDAAQADLDEAQAALDAAQG